MTNNVIPIHTSARSLADYTPPSLLAALEAGEIASKPIFWLRVPTGADRDGLQGRLIDLGLRSVSQGLIRATLIDDLWNHYPDDEAENHANLLDRVWQLAEMEEVARQLWVEQETQRVLDEMNGAPPIEPFPAPRRIISVRDQARSDLIVDHMSKCSTRVRALIAEQTNSAKAATFVMLRMQLAGYFDVPNIENRNPSDAILVDNEVAVIREALSDDAWTELISYINAMYGLSEEERKNSVSPLEKQSDLTGSLEPSGESQTGNGGTSTTSITEPAPTGESATITAPSCDTTSAVECRKIQHSPMAEI